MKIHGDVLSPFVRMCLVSAHELGLANKVALVSAAVKPAEVNVALEKLSPIGKIPVLETDHAHAIYDSRVIVEYLAHVAGSKNYIPDDGVKRFRVLTMLALAQGIMEAAVALRYEQFQRPEEKRWPAYMERLAARIGAGLDDVEEHWEDVLLEINVASIALTCAMGYIDFRHAGLNWRQGRPNTTGLIEQLAERKSFKAWPLS